MRQLRGRRCGGAASRQGVTVVELAVSLALFVFLGGLLAGLMAQVLRGAETVTRRLEIVEARRITRDLLDRGIRGGGVRNAPGTAMTLRTFVGHAEGCGGGVFAFRGRRLPDPARDSVWVLRADGTQIVVWPGKVQLGTCPPGPGSPAGRPLLLPDLASDPLTAGGVVLRFFERGRYTVSDAFRYGRSGSVLQPLTAPALDPTRSWIEAGPNWIRAYVAGAGDSTTVGRIWELP